jgi:hypothetical protein
MYRPALILCLLSGLGPFARPSQPAAPPKAASAPKAPAVDPPRLRVAPAGKVQLGSVGPREIKTQVYTFTNVSKAPISLRVFDLSPGVTVEGPALEAPIPAQGKATLVLRLDPTDWVGPQARNVRLGTDDPRQGQYYLPLMVDVRPDLKVDEDRKSFGDVAAHESPQQVFTFERETGLPTEVRLASDLPPYLECETQTEKNRTRLAFTFRAARVQPGVLMGLDRVTVETSAPHQPRFELYLSLKLHHAVDALPSRVVFLDPAQASQELKLRSHDGKPFRIVSAKVEGEGFQVGSPAASAAPEQALTVRRTAVATARSLLVLRFEGQDAPLEVPLSYLPSLPPKDGGLAAPDPR